MSEAKHDQAVSLLTGLERFVRLVVERDIPVSQAYPNNSMTSPASKPYAGHYGVNSYIANRSGNIRTPDLIKSITTPKQLPNESLNSVSKLNGVSDIANVKNSIPSMPSISFQAHPQPTPRTIGSQPNMNNDSVSTVGASFSNSMSTNAISDDRSRSPQEDIQVLKPITSEEFQAMIPIHFLRPPTSSPSPESHHVPVVTVTIKQPDNLSGDVNFPPAPTTIGKVTETITKSTLTETVVTRVTDNHLVQPVIIEVCLAKLDT